MELAEKYLQCETNYETDHTKKLNIEIDLGNILIEKCKITSEKQCAICKSRKIYFTRSYNDTLLNNCIITSLYEKYSSSQNYYYTKDINDICYDKITSNAIVFKDVLCLLDVDEFLKRFYVEDEYLYKIKLLIEYYKFHTDIPRLFMLPSSHTMNKYHDKRRKIEYNRITKLLKDEALSKNKKIALNENENEIRLTNNDSVSDSNVESFSAPRSTSFVNFSQPILPDNILANSSNGHNYNKDLSDKNNKEFNLWANDPVSSPKLMIHNSSNMTIQELNMKLGEIITNSGSRYLDCTF